ncbi:MAG: insulinase family protein [Ignavibacteria bacterium]|nr:insulinase family protein [Ignavibacteria bacterium]
MHFKGFSHSNMSDVIPRIDFKEIELSNGLKVIMSRVSEIPMVALNTTFKVGSKDEEEDKTGLAHFIEHLMFEGSKFLKSGEFDEILNRNGGESNAYTTWDSTSYYIVIPSNKLETALWLDSNRFFDISLTEKSFVKQKDVIFEEKLQVYDNTPYGSLEVESSRRLFSKSGYKSPIIGDMEHIKNMRLEDVFAFFKKYYIPNNAVLSIVGDIDYYETEKLVRKYYDDINRGEEIFSKEYFDDDIEEEITDDIFDNIHLTGKFLFYKLPMPGSKAYYAIQILNGILSNGDSSRFYKELVYRKELVNDIESYLYDMEKVSLFSISSIALEGRSIFEIEIEIDNIIEEIKSGNIHDYEVQKIKNKIEAGFNTRKLSIISLAERFSHIKTFYDDCEKINNEILNYLNITKEDIVNAANMHLNKNQRVNLNYFPINENWN